MLPVMLSVPLLVKPPGPVAVMLKTCTPPLLMMLPMLTIVAAELWLTVPKPRTVTPVSICSVWHGAVARLDRAPGHDDRRRPRASARRLLRPRRLERQAVAADVERHPVAERQAVADDQRPP